MSSLDFPSSPTNGQTYIVNGISYRYDSAVGAWLIDSYVSSDYVLFSLNHANAAFDQANTASDRSNVALSTSSAALDTSNDSLELATFAYDQANTGRNHANAAFAAANNVEPQIAPTYNQANTSRTHANAAFTQANNAYAQANAAAEIANTKLSLSGGTISGDIFVTGNLFVAGNATTFAANNLVINDPFVLLANNNNDDSIDLGFAAHYNTDLHTGLFRSSETKEWYLFKNYDAHFFYEGGGNIDLSGNNFTLDTINTNLRTSNLILGGANAIVTIGAAFDKANSTTYTSNVVISVDDNVNAALRITQIGTGDAIRVEDSVNPDSTSFVIDANGHVGIGINEPTSDLHVLGTANISELLVTGNVAVDGNVIFVNTVSNRVGIGTENPASAMHVMGLITAEAAAPLLYLRDSDATNATQYVGYIDFRDSTDTRAGYIGFGSTNTPDFYMYASDPSGNIRFHSGGTTERMRIAASGNVLIGRTTDSTVGSAVKLEVNGAVNASSLLINGQALSAKPRVFAATTNTSPLVWNSNNYDQYSFTGLSNSLTLNADSGAPSDGQKIIFRFKPSGSQSLSWTTGSANSFRAMAVTLPTSLVSGKTTYVGCIYNAFDSRWDVVATSTEP
jgi:hypothetical protein